MQSFSYRLKKLEIGLVLLDKSWRITDCDVMARSLLGRPPGTLRGCSILDLHPPSSRQKVEWLLESAAHGPASLIIALPDRTLMVRVVSLDADRFPGNSPGDGEAGALAMVLFEMDGGAESRPKSVAAADNAEVSTALAKLPISRHDGVFLLDPEKAIYLPSGERALHQCHDVGWITVLPDVVAEAGAGLGWRRVRAGSPQLYRGTEPRHRLAARGWQDGHCDGCSGRPAHSGWPQPHGTGAAAAWYLIFMPAGCRS